MHTNRHFSGVTFFIQFHIDNEEASEDSVTLTHRNFKRLIDTNDFEIPEGIATSFQEAIDWYFENHPE